jgi:hypothetical protein
MSLVENRSEWRECKAHGAQRQDRTNECGAEATAEANTMQRHNRVTQQVFN